MIEVVSIRNKLLDLALCGKLTEQFDEDGDVNTLVKEIESIRQELVEQGIVKKEKDTLEITDDNIPFDIPSSWTWMRVSEVAYLTSGKPYEEVQSGELYIKVSDMNIPENETSITTSEHFVSENNIGRISRYSIIFPKRGGAIATNKKRIVVDKEIFIDLNTMSMTIIKPEIFPYVKLWFDSLKLDELQTGTSIPQINNKDIYPLMIPIPPLKEQGRIVRLINKVDEYLKLIEELQIDYIENTEVLKRKLIDAGIQGRLTKQLPEKDTAEELYATMVEEKKQLLRERKGREDKNIKEMDEDVPYELPTNWKWVRFGEIGLFKKGPFGSALTKAMFVPKSDDTVKVYEQQHAIQKNSELGTYYITREYFDDKMSGFEVLSGDILVSCAGTIGETYILPDDIEQGIINQALMRVSLVPSVNKRFFQYYFDANLKKTAQEESNGSAIKNIPPFEVMKNWYFPLAPLKEQERIVEKIEELLSLI